MRDATGRGTWTTRTAALGGLAIACVGTAGCASTEASTSASAPGPAPASTPASAPASAPSEKVDVLVRVAWTIAGREGEAPLVGTGAHRAVVAVPGRFVIGTVPGQRVVVAPDARGVAPGADVRPETRLAWVEVEVEKLSNGVLATRTRLMEWRAGEAARRRVDALLAAPLGGSETMSLGDPDAAREDPPRGNVVAFRATLTPSEAR